MAIVSVVKYDGNPDVFAWKYPDSELGTWTQLIVNESQQAILFKGGQALDVFEAGRHTLSTNNIPFLETIINLPFGGQSPFSARGLVRQQAVQPRCQMGHAFAYPDSGPCVRSVRPRKVSRRFRYSDR